MPVRWIYSVGVICLAVLVWQVSRWAKPAEPLPTSSEMERAHREIGPIEEFGEKPDPESVARRSREIDEKLRAEPASPELLEQKIHLGIDHAPDVAIAECRRILAQDPEHHYALTHISLAFLAAGRSRDALIHAGRALSAKDDPETRELLARIYELRNENELAAKVRAKGVVR